MLSPTQNAGNPISEDLSFRHFPGEDAPRPPEGDDTISKPLLKNPVSTQIKYKSYVYIFHHIFHYENFNPVILKFETPTWSFENLC